MTDFIKQAVIDAPGMAAQLEEGKRPDIKKLHIDLQDEKDVKAHKTALRIHNALKYIQEHKDGFSPTAHKTAQALLKKLEFTQVSEKIPQLLTMAKQFHGLDKEEGRVDGDGGLLHQLQKIEDFETLGTPLYNAFKAVSAARAYKFDGAEAAMEQLSPIIGWLKTEFAEATKAEQKRQLKEQKLPEEERTQSPLDLPAIHLEIRKLEALAKSANPRIAGSKPAPGASAARGAQ